MTGTFSIVGRDPGAADKQHGNHGDVTTPQAAGHDLRNRPNIQHGQGAGFPLEMSDMAEPALAEVIRPIGAAGHTPPPAIRKR